MGAKVVSSGANGNGQKRPAHQSAKYLNRVVTENSIGHVQSDFRAGGERLQGLGVSRETSQ